MKELKPKPKKTLTPAEFREGLRNAISNNFELFFENMKKLPPREQCEFFCKVLPYAYSKVPEDKIDSSNPTALLVEKERKLTLIQGQPRMQVKDEDYEEVDE